MDGVPKHGHVSRARLHSAGAAAARAYRAGPEPTASAPESAADPLSYDEVLDARYVPLCRLC